MILILGGTTEGRIAAETLEEAGKEFYYSTKTEGQEVILRHGIRLTGALDKIDMTEFCRKHTIKLIIDAAHPFAEVLHHTISEVSRELCIPTVRFERFYPPIENSENKLIHHTDSFEEAVQLLNGNKAIKRLLALTGVQSIGKLRSFWENPEHECYCRIIDKESSREIVRKEGFPEERILYYDSEADFNAVLQRIKPDAILTKESGVTGGTQEKIKGALEEETDIYIISRPELPDYSRTVQGEASLRRAVEELLPDFFPLRSGITTGTCATAATRAAMEWMLNSLLCKEYADKQTDVRLPSGEYIPVTVEQIEGRLITNPENATNAITANVTATVVKDAGDDPDVTNGMEIKATVTATLHLSKQGAIDKENAIGLIHLNSEYPFKTESQHIPAKELDSEFPPIQLCGGEGIGTVTLPGLGLEVGGPAINKGPRKMIMQNIREVVFKGIAQSVWFDQQHPIQVTISAPEGESIAKRTFNPRLGVEGGISIIGTTGIVKPFSSEAFVSSIRKSMEVALATGSPRIVINSGAKSEKFIKAFYPELPAQAFVHYGNFIGETLKIAAELRVGAVTMGLMIGKAVKLAEGYLDTHSKNVTMNKDFLCEVARTAGCSAAAQNVIRQMTLAREIWTLMTSTDLHAFSNQLITLCHMHCDPLLPDGQLTIFLISDDGSMIEHK